MKYQHILNAVRSQAWAIQPEKMDAIMTFLEFAAAGGKFDADEVQARIDGVQPKARQIKGAVAVLPLHGVIAQRMDMFTEISGGTSTDRFGADFDTVIDDKGIGAVLIDIDSPGGSVYGVQELASRIRNARGKKPLYGIANSLMASAAYWIGSAVDQLFITPGGEVGSIGIISVHADFSAANEKQGVRPTYITAPAGKYKAEGNPDEPLGAEALSHLQGLVDEYYERFVSDVALQRFGHRDQKSIGRVRQDFGEGRTMLADAAVKAGMVDGIATFDGLLAALVGKLEKQAQRRKRAEARKREIEILDARLSR